MPPRQTRYPHPAREYHVVVLGAGGVGKSCLTAQFVHNEWIESYDPTIEDSYRTQMTVDQRQVVLEILDTAGTDQFVAMRDLYMKTAGLRDEIIRIKDDDNVPIVICGNKADLEDHRAVPRARGFEVSQRWGAPYYETSARTKTNVEEAFIDLSRQMLRKDDASGERSRRNAEYDQFSQYRRRRRRRDQHGTRCVIL